MKLDLQIKIIDDKDSSVIQQERIVKSINTTTAKETDSNIFNPIYGICNSFPESIPNGIPSTICDNPLVVQPSHTFGNFTPSQFEMRLNQLETIVASLTGENAKLKEKIKKLEDREKKKSSTQPATKSNKENSCVHNDYVAYLYNNVYPNVDPFSSTNVDYEKWQAGMGYEVLNFHNSLYSMSIISDDGEVIRFKCNRCRKEFTVDRRLMTFAK